MISDPKLTLQKLQIHGLSNPQPERALSTALIHRDLHPAEATDHSQRLPQVDGAAGLTDKDHLLTYSDLPSSILHLSSGDSGDQISKTIDTLNGGLDTYLC